MLCAIRYRRLTAATTFFFVLYQILLCFPIEAWANPAGGQVTAGQAVIQQYGTTLTVTQGTPRAVVNWQGFSIGSGETTRFIQPSAASAILNRVTGFGPSQLDGSLTANGQVFLINPNGVVIGPGGRIETAGFVASTLNVPDAAFMAGGNLVFEDDSAAGIRNLGLIKATAGDIILAARTVENLGTLQAPGGVVGLAAGNEVLYRPTGIDRLFVKSALALPETTDGVTNTGLIEAAQAELKAAGGNVYTLAVNNGGAIHATGVSLQDGRVLLTSSGGSIKTTGVITATKTNGDGGEIRLQAEGEGTGVVTVAGSLTAVGAGRGTTGGDIIVTGNTLALTETARVDASGDSGGGLVRIGGDYRGQNPEIAKARETTVAEGAEIRADALTSGDGGRVIVWSDEATRFEGALTARGGSLSGNGGFAEVSGKRLFFQAVPDLGAPQGRAGALLLDPEEVYIGDIYPTAGDEPSYLNTVTIANILKATDFYIEATKGIYFKSGMIKWGTDRTLSLTVKPASGSDAYGMTLGYNPPPGYTTPIIAAVSGGLYLQPWKTLLTGDDLLIVVKNLSIKPVVSTQTFTGNFNISGKVTAENLTILAGGHTSCGDNCSFSMNNAANSIASIVIGDGNGPTPREAFLNGTSIQALPGNFSIYSSTSTSVETKGWVQFEGNVSLLTDGDLTLKNFIGFDSALTGEQLVLASAGKFINAGAASTFYWPTSGTLSFQSHFPWAGRVLIFSTDPRLDTLGDLPGAETLLTMNGRIYDKSYADLSTIPDGNWFVYTLAPTVTITALDAAKTYGEDNPAFPWEASTGLIAGDSLAGNPEFTTMATKQSDAGSYDIAVSGIGTLSGPLGYRFVFDPVTAALTINKRSVAIGLSNVSRLYGEENPLSFPAVYTGLTDWDKDPLTGEPLPGVFNGLTFSTAATPKSNTGTYLIGRSGDWPTSSNYNIDSVWPATLTITPAPLTVTANNIIRRIGDANPPYTVTYSGLKSWDNPGDSNVLTGPAFNSPPDQSADPGNYLITPSGGWARNYTLSYVPGVFTIKQPYQLVITANDAGKIYGDANPGFSATYVGFEDGDTSAVVSGLTFTTPAGDRSVVGTYAINPGSAVLPAYYTISYVPGSLFVTPRDLLLKAADASAQYGVMPTFSYTATGLLAGDTLSVEPTLTPGGGMVGSHPIYLTGGAAANYTIIRQNGTLTITPAPLFVRADDKSMFTGQSYPLFTATVTGLQYSDGANVVQGLNLVTDAAAASIEGTYAIAQSGPLIAANYAPITFSPGALKVKPSTITIEVKLDTVSGGLLTSQQPVWTSPFGVPLEAADTMRYIARDLIFKLGLNVSNIDVWLSAPVNRVLMTDALMDFLKEPLIPGSDLYRQREIIKNTLQEQIRALKVVAAEQAVEAFNEWKAQSEEEFQRSTTRLEMTMYGGDTSVPDLDFEAEAMTSLIATSVSVGTLAAVATFMSATGSVLSTSLLAGAAWVTSSAGTFLMSASTAAVAVAQGGQLGATLAASTASTVLGPAAIIVAAVVVGACRVSQIVERGKVEQKYANLVDNARNFDINSLIYGDDTAQTELASFLMISAAAERSPLQLVNR